MLPTPPSSAFDYTLIFSGDPALEQPVRVEPEDAAGNAAWDARLKEWQHALGVARATGDWTPLLKAGQEPTRFVLRQVPGDVWGALQRLFSGLSLIEQRTLMLRAALVRIEHGPDHKLKFEEHRDVRGNPTGLGQVLTVATTNLLDAIESPAHGIKRGDVVAELGWLAFARRQGLDLL
jgi:hypothetical protein